ncbi:MAG: phage tail protein [Eubacterium sp.]
MASYTIGPKIGMDGEADFRKSLNNINESLRTLESELKKTSSEFSSNASSEEALKAKNEVLNRSIEQQEQKIQEVKKALEYSKSKYGENATQTQKWQRVLNNAETDLNNMKIEIEKNEDAIDKMGKEEEDAAKETKKMADAEDDASEKTEKLEKAADGLKTGLKVAATAIGAVAAAAGKLGVESIKAYSDTEQLVGGVETLFKDSADTVIKYADNAYKTASLSANGYMETVTSFSASLLQGLDGNTEKAAQIANLAITDMADNANKMGTDMESIQNAYQGFAKQNYTMLDNLKLGYGGTKEEMIRLINDSGILKEKIDSLDNVSFDQIIQAIHAVQDDLDITGTTAKEASTTIDGSANSMKAAWTDFLAGIADGNQDTDLLLSNLLDSVMTFGDNVIPVIETILSNVADISNSDLKTILADIINALSEILPDLLEVGVSAVEALISGIVDALPTLASSGIELIFSLADGIIQAIPDLLAAIPEIVFALIDGLTENFPLLIQSGVDMLTKLGEGMKENLPALIEQALNSIDAFADMLTENLPLLIEAGIQMLFGLIQGLSEALPTLIEKVPEIVSKFADLINDNMPTILKAGIQLLIELVKGIIQAIPTLIENIPKIIKAIIKVWEAYNWLNLGKTVISGLKKGVTGNLSKVKDIGKNILDHMKNSNISKLPAEALKWGKDLILNFIKGIKSKISSLISSVTDVAKTITSYLHFSVPDVGPLTDAPNWMPDMIDLMTQGIYKNESKLKNAAHSLAGVLSDGLTVNANLKNSSAGEAIYNFSSPVYLDGRIISDNTQKYITQSQMAKQVARGVISV